MSVVSCKLSIPLCAGESANSWTLIQGNLIHCIAGPRIALMPSAVGSSSLLTHSALAHSLDAWNTVISPQFKVSLFIIVC